MQDVEDEVGLVLVGTDDAGVAGNNTTDIQPERHSTDTHGTNQINFWLLFFDGYQFAPRYRDLQKRIASLVDFRHPAHHAGRLIKPVRKTRDALIVEEWPNIQRIMASLAQKDVTRLRSCVS